MKTRTKLITTIIITILFVSIAGMLSYLWILEPISFTAETVEERLSDFTYYDLVSEEKGQLNLEEFGGELPSDNYEDYRSIFLEFNANYRSIFYLQNLQATIESIDTENKKYVIRTRVGQFPDGQTMVDHFMTRDVSGVCLDIYVGDLKNEEEIKKVALDIARHTKIKILYNMQWVGNRECEFIFPQDFSQYSFFEFVNE